MPMLPPTWQGIPHSFRIWPISAVVVVLPFEPVMPHTGPAKKVAGQFDFADDRNALRARRLTGAISTGTPGDSTIRSTAGEYVFRLRRGRLSIGRSSEAITTAPLLRSSSTAAIAGLPMPATNTFRAF